MIDKDDAPHRIVAAGVPADLPAAATVRSKPLPGGRSLEMLAVPLTGDDQSAADTARGWVEAVAQSADTRLPATVAVPLYGCHVIWSPTRAAVLGPADRLDGLVAAVSDFAIREAELGDCERRCDLLLATVESDADAAFDLDDRLLDRRYELAARFREAVATRRGLALLAPAVHQPAVHPPTIASQLGERLRERTRLVERHEFAVGRAEFVERIYEACGQRVSDHRIARRQTALEWTIVVLLVVQTVMLVVEQLASRGAS